MSAKVVVESAGTHHFKLDERDGHGKPIVAELCEQLLNKAGYTRHAEWTLRIEKTLPCSAESRVVRVVSCTHFGVHIRLKASPHATSDHLFLLMRPDGTSYNYNNLMQQLKASEKSISRNWQQDLRRLRLEAQAAEQAKQEDTVPTPDTVEIEFEELEPALCGLNGPAGPDPLDIEPASYEPPPSESLFAPLEGDEVERPAFPHLAGTIQDPTRLQYVLRKIHTLAQTPLYRSVDEYRQTVSRECGFDKDGHALRHVMLILSQIARRGYMTFTLENDRCQKVGYVLTDLGRRVAGGDFAAMPKIKRVYRPRRTAHVNGEATNGHATNRVQEFLSPPRPAKPDYARTLIDFTEQAQALADTGKRLAQIGLDRDQVRRDEQQLDADYNRQKQELAERLKALDAEQEMLCTRMIGGQESYVLVARLKKVQATAPPAPVPV